MVCPTVVMFLGSPKVLQIAKAIAVSAQAIMPGRRPYRQRG
jgi:hypothetical protein